MEIVLASSNKGKIKEFRELLKPYDITVLSLADIGFTQEIVENGDSFLANALIKAQTVYDYIHKPVVADDSGLCVSALNGAPGIYSARYMGLTTDKLRRKGLLDNLKNVLNRKAYFNCTIVYYKAANDYQSFTGICNGTITEMEKGTNGFGYDSIFIPDGATKTFAMMSDEEKNQVSHRAYASAKFVEYLKNDFNNK